MALRHTLRNILPRQHNRNRDAAITTLEHTEKRKDNRRIVIIGAGIAGISMAWLLSKRGFSNVVILEAAARTGGKIYTQWHNDIPHELGACYTQPAYHGIHHLLQKYRLNARIGVAGRTVHRDCGSSKPFGDDVIAELRKVMTKRWKHLPDVALKGRILVALRRYKKLHRDHLGDYSGQLPPRPPPVILQQLALSFLAWLKEHQLDILVPIFRLFQSAQGYGYLETIPAFYGLMWNKPEVIDIATEQMRGKGQGATLIAGGLSALLDALVNDMKVEILHDRKVSTITRQPQPSIEAIDSQQQSHHYAADEIIVACPHDIALPLLSKPTKLESELFSSLLSASMTTTLQSAIQPTNEPIDSWFDNLVPGRDHHVITQRCSQAFIQPAGFTDPDEPIERVIYQYGEQAVSRDHIATKYSDHQVKIGVQQETIRQRCHWPGYFRHWNGSGIRTANPWRLLEMQGLQQCWWIGSSACFESINDVLEYNLLLCRRYIDNHASPLHRSDEQEP